MKWTLCTRWIRMAAALGWMVTAAPAPAATTGDSPDNGDLALARRLENAFVKVADEASASVVVITSTRKVGGAGADSEGDGDGNPFEGTPWEFFFRHRGLPGPRDLDSQGSGIILRADGYILTNNHVVDGADALKVRLKDGREFEAHRVGNDNRTDVAVIKVDAQDLPAAQLGDSDVVKVGQWAIAIGAPFELDYSFTVGFISATGRSAVWSRSGSAYEDYLQTDASINPGNSGGPLCDIEGRVVGMNTLIRGLNRGIGFAIPINMARDIASQLIERGKIVRPWLGIQIEPLAEGDENDGVFKDVKEGVVVRAIYPDTPAANSDLKPADVIVKVDGTTVKTPRDLQRQILRKRVGDAVVLEVVRGSKKVKVSMKTGELPDQVQVASQPMPRSPSPVETSFGITVQTLNKELAEKLELGVEEGVVITAVTEGSAAEEKGLQHGDVIAEVNRAAVRTADDFQKALEAADPVKGVLLYVKRGGASTFVVLKQDESK